MDISLYFEAIDISNFDNQDDYLPTSLGEVIKTFTTDSSFPDLKDTDIALIGVKEDRNAVNNEGCGDGPDYVRNKLYQLYQGAFDAKITDLGNIAKGDKIEDTYFALSTVIGELLKENIVPVILGGSQDLTYANYAAYENVKQTINMAVVGSTFDLGVAGQELDSKSFLSKIILHQPNYLFN